MVRILLLFVLLGFLFNIHISAEETTAVAPTSGDGTLSSPYEIATLANLRWLSETSDAWGSYFIQTADIDASESSEWNSEAGFSPIGNKTTNFTGSYIGQGHIISGLTINRSEENYIGLFGYTYGAEIENIGLSECSVTGYNFVGGIAGYNRLTINSCYVTGSVTGNEYVGGLVGYNRSSITNSYVTGTVSGEYFVGGLVGINYSRISNCYATESVTGSSFVGRLVGMNYSTVSNCYYMEQLLDLTSGIGSDYNSQTVNELTSEEMQSLASFTNWDFAGVTTDGSDEEWAISTGTNDGYPVLLWELDVAEPELGELSATLDGTSVDLTCSFNSLGVPNPVAYGFYYSSLEDISLLENEDWLLTDVGVIVDLGEVNGSTDALGASDNFSGIISDITDKPTYYIVAYAINAVDTVYSNIATININDAPEITSTAVTEATEDIEYTYQVVVDDPDNDALTYSLSNAPEGMEISSDGEITWTPGEGVLTSGEVTVTVSDGEYSDTQTFTITVTAVNDAPVITSTAVTSATEDIEYSYQVVATDPEGDELTYSLSTAPDGMEISTDGLITWTPGEGVTSAEVTVVVSDGDLYTTQTFTITVTAVNDAPVITSTAVTSATEDVEYSYQVVASDPDDDELTYSLSTAPEGMEISADGLITWTPGEGVTSGEVIVVVSDGEYSDAQTYTITVTAVNDAPVITSTAITAVKEDVEYSYQVVATDAEGDALTYSLSTAPDGMEISADGLITWTPGEGVTSGEVTVVVSDGDLYTTQTFTITVTAVNDAPVITSTAVTSATEDIEYSYQVVATDAEGDELTYSLSTAPDGMEISADGLITWTPEESVSSGEVTVVVSDGDLYTTQTYTITVTAVNDPPVITSTAITSATEDVEYSYQVVATDAEGDALTYSLSTAPEGMEISETGLIIWTPGEGVSSGEVTVVVSDGDLYTTQTFTITVTAVNDAPVITSTAITAVKEDVEYSYQVVAVDAEDDVLTYSLTNAPEGMEISSDGLITWTAGEGISTSGEVTVVVSDGKLYDTQSFIITVRSVNDAPVITSSAITSATEDIEYSYQVEATDSDGDALTYSLTNAPEGMEISSEGLITWIPGEGVTSSGEVTVIVSDFELNDTQSFTIVVTAVNDAPVITSTAINAVKGNTEYSYQVVASDAEGDELTYSLSNAPDGMVISSEGLITWTPADGITTSGEITVTVSDGELSDTQTFTITVRSENEAPEITSTAITIATEDVEYSYQVVATDADGDVLSYSLSNAPEGMEISSAGLITWTPGEGVTTSGEVTVIVSDFEFSDTQSFTVIVTAVNDAPEITSTAITSAIEDEDYSYQVVASDAEGDELVYSLSNAPEGMEISADGLITWTPEEGVVSAEVTVVVSDGELYATQIFTITVTAVNDAPVITSEAETIATEDIEYSYQVEATDPDGDELTYSLSNAPEGMEISADGLIIWTPEEGVVSAEVTVVVSDGEFSDTQSFTITVTAVNDAPVIISEAVTIAIEDIEYSYQVEATDPEGDALTYSLSEAPEGMEISSDGLITWTPGEGVTDGDVTVVVSDGELSDKQSFTVIVTVVNDAPVITSVADTIATEDLEYSYQVEATDPEGDLLTFSLSEAPEGMEISSDGLITWTPAERTFTSGEVVVVVSDGELTDTQTFIITVEEDIDSFNVYPNPATTTLYIDGAKGVVTFYNLAGKKVYSYDLYQNYIIDISFLPNGVYLVKVDGHVVKIVKQ